MGGWEDVEGAVLPPPPGHELREGRGGEGRGQWDIGFWGKRGIKEKEEKTNTDVDGEIDNFMPHAPTVGETKMLVKSRLIFPNPSVTLPNPVFLSLT